MSVLGFAIDCLAAVVFPRLSKKQKKPSHLCLQSHTWPLEWYESVFFPWLGVIGCEHALFNDMQEDELKDSGLKQGGVLTPATAMGMVLVRRIQKAGVSFDLQ